MLNLKADLHCKDNKIYAKNCVVEKVVQLPGREFDAFSRDLMAYKDFIKDNRDLMYSDGDGTQHCLLVTGDERQDGILVQAEGYDYARYAGHVPHVHSIIAMDRYPALAGLCRKLSDMADHIVAEGMNAPGEDRAFISMDDLEAMSGIDVAYNGTIVSTLSDMLGDRPEIADWEIDKNEFIITPKAPAMEQSHEPEPGPMMGM